MDADFKKQALVDMNEQLIHKWISVTNMYSSPVLYTGLDVFSSSISLVLWLKKAINSV